MTTELAPPPPPAGPDPAVALKVEDLSLAYVVRGIRRPVLRGVSFEVKAGRVVRAGRRVGLRQVHDRLRRGPLPAPQRGHHRRTDPRRRRRHHEDDRRRGAPVPDASRLDGLPGSRRRPEPDDQGRTAGRRGLHDPRPGQGRGPREALAPRAASRSATRSGCSSATRTSCRAACSSASSSPSRWRRTPSSWSSTSRRPASMRRSRRASSTSCAPCRPRRTRRSSSSPTTSASSGHCATGSGSCTPARSSRRATRRRSSSPPQHPYTLVCCDRCRATGSASPSGPCPRSRQPAPDRHQPADVRVRRSLPAGHRPVPDGRAADRRARRRPLDAAATIATAWASWSSRRHGGRGDDHGDEALSVTGVSKTFHQSGRTSRPWSR